MEQDLQAALPHAPEHWDEFPAMIMAKVTDSSARERSSGPQAQTVFQKAHFKWQRTSHISLLSIFLAIMLRAVGEVGGPDEADTRGMDLWDMSESRGCQWNEALMRSSRRG